MTMTSPRQIDLSVDVSPMRQSLAGNSSYGDAGGLSQISPSLNSHISLSSTQPLNSLSPVFGSFKCNHPRCLTCADFIESATFCSSVTGRTYCVINEVENVRCDSVNIIYLITCKYCFMQYVGESIQKFSTRMGQHRRSKPTDSGVYGCKVLSEHFSKYPCCGFGFTCQIIKKFLGDGRLSNGSIDAVQTKQRRECEDIYIKAQEQPVLHAPANHPPRYGSNNSQQKQLPQPHPGRLARASSAEPSCQ